MRAHDAALAFLITVLSLWCGQGLSAASSEYSKNEISLHGEPFEYRLSAGATKMGWVKFAISKEANGLGPVTNQDSHTYQSHYEFVSRHEAKNGRTWL